jgi:hypothetical protein
MSFNGSGTFLINTAGQPVVAGTVISSTAFNALTADLATGLSTVITKDGQTTVTANIPMSTYKFTGLGVGSAATDSANLSQVQSTVTKLLTSVSGADTITAVGAPVVAAYAAGQMFYFVATGDNTGAVTLNIDSLGAKAVTRDGSVALAAGDIKSGEVVVVVYDGTRFQVVSQLNSAGNATFANVSITSALNVGGVATFTANPVLSGGTANGVLYLNGSKVATSGTALVFDGTNLSGTGSIGTTIAGKTAQFDAAGGSIYASFADGTKTWRFGAGIISAGAISLYNATDAVTAFTVDATGNLGIGTSSPGAKLDVVNASGIASNLTHGASSIWGVKVIASGSTELQFSGNISGNSGPSIRAVTSGGAAYAPLTLDGSTVTLKYGGTTGVLLDSSGNLGIGTTSPGVFGVSSRNITVTAASGYSYLQLQGASGNGGAVDFGDNSVRHAEIASLSGSALAFYTNGSNSGNTVTERARITSGGDLCVNTTSAISGCRVTIVDSGNAEQLALSGANQTGIQLKNSTGGDGWIIGRSIFGSNANDFFIFDHENSVTRFFIGTTGEVIVSGTTDNGAYNLQCNGTGVWGAGAYVNGSDARLKDNIQSLDSGLDVVKAMRPVTFQYKPEYSKDQNVQPGFIAQELQEAMAGKQYLDGVVQSGPEHLNVAYQNIIPILVKAIQELEAKVAALESK